ncbi:hypothetical protein ACK12G_36685, partial [Mycolicibacterium wolinskyi]
AFISRRRCSRTSGSITIISVDSPSGHHTPYTNHLTPPRAADGSDAHYAHLAAAATVTQLRTAVKLEPHPDPKPQPEPKREITKDVHDDYTTYR